MVQSLGIEVIGSPGPVSSLSLTMQFVMFPFFRIREILYFGLPHSLQMMLIVSLSDSILIYPTRAWLAPRVPSAEVFHGLPQTSIPVYPLLVASRYPVRVCLLLQSQLQLSKSLISLRVCQSFFLFLLCILLTSSSLGKPSPLMCDFVLRRILEKHPSLTSLPPLVSEASSSSSASLSSSSSCSIPPSILAALKPRVLVCGDRLETDIAFGTANDIVSLLMMTGSTSYDKLATSTTQPTFYADTFLSLLSPEPTSFPSKTD
jgi:hypothetical protein